MIRLAVVPSWRPEVGHVADAIRDALRPDGSDGMTVLGSGRRGVPVLVRGEGDVAILASDTGNAQRLLSGSGRRRRDAHVFRLWWNGADEAVAYVRDRSSAPDGRRQETHVCFFADVGRDMAASGLDHVYAPYAFTPVTPARPATDARAMYAGEVDISDDCFAGTGIEAGGGGARAWDQAREIIAGRSTLLAADQASASVNTPDDHRVMLWAVRNRVRYLLLQDLVNAFPGRIHLRGNDWIKLGFDAEPTKFNRRLRVHELASHFVSLDLGSKSTHAALYPRSAEIMAAAGGIAQLDSGEPLGDWSTPLVNRRAGSSSALQALVDRLLSTSATDLAAENAAIQSDYARARSAAGRRLVEAIKSRVDR
jgi:hypothetical protein